MTSPANRERGVALDESSGRSCSCFKEESEPERHGEGYQKEGDAVCAAAKIREGKTACLNEHAPDLL